MFLRKIQLRKEGKEYTYLKVVENVRLNGRPVQKTLVNLGNVSVWPTQRLEQLVDILNRFLGREPNVSSLDLAGVRISHCRQLGPYLPLAHLWEQLGMDALIRRAWAGRKMDEGAISCIKVMVLTRLVAPTSKRGVCELAQEQAQIPGVEAGALMLHQYYRALTALSEVQTEVEAALYQRTGHLFNQDVSLVFYDVTSAYFEGTHCPIARHGYSREHRPDLLQIEVGLMVDAEGMPIGHEVFDGNVKDVTTVLSALERLTKTFQVRRCVFIGDDGIASQENLDAVEAAGYEYITSLSLGNSRVGQELLSACHTPWRWEEVKPTLRVRVLREEPGRTYVGAYNPATARAQRRHRTERLRKCIAFLRQLQAPPKKRGRRRTQAERLASAKQFMLRKKAQDLIGLKETENGFTWSLDRRALRRARRQDGVMILLTNSRSLKAPEVAEGYRTLYRVEDAFRHMKDGLGLRPIRHWNDKRVPGHVFVCVLAYLIECLYDRALKEARMEVTARKALDGLSDLTVATLSYEDRQVRRRSEISAYQRRLLAAAGVDHVPEVW